MKKVIIGFILGTLIAGIVGVLAANTISSSIVTYNNKTVEKSLDELYDEAVTGKGLIANAITNKGVATSNTSTFQTMATNINSIDTDHSAINQSIASLNNELSNIKNKMPNIHIIETSLTFNNGVATYDFSTDVYILSVNDVANYGRVHGYGRIDGLTVWGFTRDGFTGTCLVDIIYMDA